MAKQEKRGKGASNRKALVAKAGFRSERGRPKPQRRYFMRQFPCPEGGKHNVHIKANDAEQVQCTVCSKKQVLAPKAPNICESCKREDVLRSTDVTSWCGKCGKTIAVSEDWYRETRSGPLWRYEVVG